MNNPIPDANNPSNEKGIPTEPKSDSQSFPIPEIKADNLSLAELFSGSKLWVVTFACLAFAIGLVWWNNPETGLVIQIHFPEGHGLEKNDAVRFRGIDVGEVTQVELNDELSGVDVTVTLKPFADQLACEGTRFWIVRPELSISGISGLETAVGHKYVGLLPGDQTGPRQRIFTGLHDSPPDALDKAGIELTFRGEKRYSVSAGSPVTYRGVEIGRILDVGISSDARHVDVRARIFDQHRNIITTKSVFWASSGVNVDVGMSGFSLDTESLETIARGGVSMLTIENGGKQVESGHIFSLHPSANKDWWKLANSVASPKVPLRGTIPLVIQWQRSGILGESDKTKSANGLPVKNKDGKSFLLFPGDVCREPSKLVKDSFKLGVASQLDSSIALPAKPNEEASPSDLDRLAVPEVFSQNWLDASDFRNADEIEDCTAVRASITDNGEMTFVHYPIEKYNINQDWQLLQFDGDSKVWHGTTVLSNQDGKVIGMLAFVPRSQPQIVRVPSNLLE